MTSSDTPTLRMQSVEEPTPSEIKAERPQTCDNQAPAVQVRDVLGPPSPLLEPQPRRPAVAVHGQLRPAPESVR